MNDRDPASIAVIGLVGAIGAGKSTVAKLLAQQGCVVCDSDALAREAYRDPAVAAQVVSWWGDSVRAPDGSIDRRQVASRIFASGTDSPERVSSAHAERRRLEALVHPWIEARRREIQARLPAGTRAFVIDAPLLVEAGIHKECTSVIFVDAPRAARLDRLQRERGWSEAELARRESAQMPLDLKRGFADHVLINDADLESLRAQVARTLSLILNVQ